MGPTNTTLSQRPLLPTSHQLEHVSILLPVHGDDDDDDDGDDDGDDDERDSEEAD